MSKGVVISLFDYTGNMVLPWAMDGYRCIIYDIQHPIKGVYRDFPGEGCIEYRHADLINGVTDALLPPFADIHFAASFSPCDDTSVSGARWFKGKGLRSLADSIRMFATGVELLEKLDCPGFAEHPVSTISSYYREPDFWFHPFFYSGYPGGEDDWYYKRTHGWTFNDFVIPERRDADRVEAPDDRIHKAAPGPDRANFRSATPMGFAQAVKEANT